MLLERNIPIMILNVDGNEIKITNPEKLIWPNLGIRKVDYVKHLIELAPYIIPYTEDRLLTTIRYPDGIEGKSFYQKQIPDYAPKWIDTILYKGNEYINLNNRATLIWLANQAALEFHVAFDKYTNSNYPTSIVFDLDPSKEQSFEEVINIAKKIHSTLTELDIQSFIKTSGATGAQIFIPIHNNYDYNTARDISLFFAQYFCEKHPNLLTIERLKKNRGNKLYFDYLQMWHGKTIIAPYSPRATKNATISTPITWKELDKKISPSDFNIISFSKRLKNQGDIFSPINNINYAQNLDFILQYV